MDGRIRKLSPTGGGSPKVSLPIQDGFGIRDLWPSPPPSQLPSPLGHPCRIPVWAWLLSLCFLCWLLPSSLNLAPTPHITFALSCRLLNLAHPQPVGAAAWLASQVVLLLELSRRSSSAFSLQLPNTLRQVLCMFSLHTCGHTQAAGT